MSDSQFFDTLLSFADANNLDIGVLMSQQFSFIESGITYELQLQYCIFIIFQIASDFKAHLIISEHFK